MNAELVTTTSSTDKCTITGRKSGCLGYDAVQNEVTTKYMLENEIYDVDNTGTAGFVELLTHVNTRTKCNRSASAFQDHVKILIKTVRSALSATSMSKNINWPSMEATNNSNQIDIEATKRICIAEVLREVRDNSKTPSKWWNEGVVGDIINIINNADA